MQKKRIITFIVIIVLISLIFTAWAIFGKKEKSYPFNQVAEIYAKLFNRIWDEYEFHSLEIYFLEDDTISGVVNCYVHAKYNGYVGAETGWSEIDEVYFGDSGWLHSFYCLNWDSIEGFEDVNAQYERAVKEGVKKVYTPEEIEALLEKNRKKE